MTDPLASIVPSFLFRLWLIALSALLTACAEADHAGQEPTQYHYKLETSLPHDRTLFTQGLLRHDNLFYESGGRYGQSRVVVYREDARAPSQEHRLDDRFFAEGLTELNGRLYLLTWRERTLWVLDTESLEPLTHYTYDGEGWGLTDNGELLIRSDGSDQLFFHSLEDFSEVDRLRITERGQPIHRLNELEYIKGFIWANIWHENRLVQIDPDSGHVVGSLDLTALVRRERPRGQESVLNGIAYEAENNALWVTGKNWSRLYRLTLEPAL